MQRRTLLSSAWAAGLASTALPLLSAHAQAGTISQSDATAALRAALDRGARVAVSQLGRPDGFMSNDKIRIPLPDALDKAAPLLRTLGRGRQLDELLASMNHAAENAVGLALPLLSNAIKTMSVRDARQILGGGEHSVTDFFAARTREPLNTRLLPVVSQSIDKLALTRQYNELIGKAAGLGLLSGARNTTLEQHVTGRTLDGLYFVIGEEERRIRTDPLASGSALLKKVFSAL